MRKLENEKGIIDGGGVGLSMQKGRELMHGRRWERGFDFNQIYLRKYLYAWHWRILMIGF